VCEAINRVDVEFCHQCRAPLALSYAAERNAAAPHLLAVAGPPGAGKTVYLGMLTDQLARHRGPLQILVRGAYSVTLQQACMSALARRRFPETTCGEPESWNWVHCEVSGAVRGRALEVVMPDISGESLRCEIERPHTYRVIRAFLSRCHAAMILVDTDALERGDESQGVWAVKFVNYLVELDPKRKATWAQRPTAVVFTKSDCNEVCQEDPEKYASERVPGFYRVCRERLHNCAFFAVTVAAASVEVESQGEIIPIALRVEPHGVGEPFAWITQRLAKHAR
jgi:hypothetical protein